MNYSNIYNALIERAKNRVFPKNYDEYTEEHHIIPRCMGGLDISENIVVLTAREHYLAHGILVKIHKNNKKVIWKLISAFRYMCVHNSKKRSGNRDYAWMRKLYSKNHPMKNPEISIKVSRALLGKKRINVIPSITKTCKCGCGQTFITKINDKKNYIDPKHYGHAITGLHIRSEIKLKQSTAVKKYVRNLNETDALNRMENSCWKCDHIKRGKAISAGKKGKSTKQYEIMKQRYIKMSETDFQEYIKNKTKIGKLKLISLRNKWLNE